jgi:hypothetical protein
MASKTPIRWTTSKRGTVHHAYQDHRLVGFLQRHDTVLGIAYAVTQVPTGAGPQKNLGQVGGGTPAEALAAARTWLENIINA